MPDAPGSLYVRPTRSGSVTTAETPARVDGRVAAATPPRRASLPSPTGGGPRWREWLDPRRPVMAATLTAGILHLVWGFHLANNGGDLAAQAAWTTFARKNPEASYNLAWYGGMHPASYSVLSPYLMGWFGIRTVAAVTGTLSATFTALLLVRFKAPMAMAAAVWAAFAISCNSASGRVTFGLGLLFALAAVFPAFSPRGTPALRAGAMLVLGMVATLASPVAGLFLMVLAAALFLTGRRRAGLMLALGPPLVVAATSALFPFYGKQPISTTAIVLPTLASVVAVTLCAPRSWRVIRVGAGVYLLGILLTWAIPSPIGSNVERLALLFGGMFLIMAVARTTDRRRLAVLCVAFMVTAGWQVVKPVDDIIHTRPASATARHSPGLITALGRLGAAQGRIEVVPLRSHWEAYGLSRHFILARGWNRQVDAHRNTLFYDETLSPATYHDWLHKWAVQYVVLPEREVDWAARHEAALVRSGQPYLSEVWRDRHWRVYRVADPAPLADAPATVERISPDRMVVKVPGKASVLLRISWSPWLSVRGHRKGCLARAGDFVRLDAPGPGRYHVQARYELPRGTPCPDA
ncbi:MFS transporter [Actinomadura fulvescens]|uniref:MFS transporter n=1 Tax=Actinomadura fulvescens TaxID=46160 RepID=A0ABN3PD80_9ACTN